jgi:hypothetical protein
MELLLITVLTPTFMSAPLPAKLIRPNCRDSIIQPQERNAGGLGLGESGNQMKRDKGSEFYGID